MNFNEFLLNLPNFLTKFNYVMPLILIIFIKNRKSGINIFITVMTGIILNSLIKNILKMPLPIEIPYNFSQEAWERIRLTTYSMPSGHSNFAALLVFSIAYELKNLSKSKFLRNPIKILLYFALIFTSFKIYYLGYHHFIDIIIGIFSAYLYLKILTKYIFNNEKFTTILLLIFSIIGFLMFNGIVFSKQFHLFKPAISCLILVTILYIKNELKFKQFKQFFSNIKIKISTINHKCRRF